MLQELLNRLANGGLDITVIDLSSPRKASDPVMTEAISLMRKLIATEQIVRTLHTTLTDHHYPDKASQLKNWWASSCKPADEIVDIVAELPEDEAERKSVLARIAELNDVLRPLVTDLAQKVSAIAERQVIAICEVDITDILV